MSWVSSVAAITASVLLCACEPGLSAEPPGELQGVAHQAIVGGTPTSTDPNVFMLLIEGDNGQGSLCSATLIDRRSLLTAAHCVDPSILGATRASLTASNAATQDDIAWGVNTWPVIETRTHPDWNSVTLTGDLAMALLETAPNVPPKPWNSSPLEGMTGLPLRAVGYGTTGGSGTGSGVKRTVDLTLRQLNAHHLYLGDRTSRGICHGDSGGPSFHTFTDGVERVVGVHSFTLGSDCLDGADSRVDASDSFVQIWLQWRAARARALPPARRRRASCCGG